MKKKHYRQKHKKTGFSRNKVILLIVIVVLLTVAVTAVVYNIYSIFDVQEYEYYFTVTESTVGFNLGTDALYFGGIPQGGSAERYINITNTHERPLKAIISFSGQGSEYISASDNSFILNLNQTNKITVTADIAENTGLGNYTGTIKIIFKKT